MRIKRYKAIIFLLLFPLFTNLTNLQVSKTKKSSPNIILILADDLGYGDPRCYNPDSKIPTSAIDQLAAEGMLFTDAHASAAACTPTRYGILTGRYAWRGRLKNWVIFPYDYTLIEKNRPTIASILKDNGYQTAMIGKWHLGWNWPLKPNTQANIPWTFGSMKAGTKIDLSQPIGGGPASAGFDYHFGVDVPNYPPYCFIENGKILGSLPNQNKPDTVYGNPGLMQEGWELERILPTITQKAVDFITNRRKQQPPFFLFFSLTAPHTPIVPSMEYAGMSQAGDYGDLVVQVDHSVNAIMEALKRAKIDKNTLVIFTSDNGSPGYAGDPFLCGKDWHTVNAVTKKFGHLSNGKWRGVKADIWEGGHRVPLIARWPKHIEKGTKSDALVSLTDLMATFVKITGISVPDETGEDSFDFSTALLEKTPGKLPREAMIQHAGDGTFAIRKGAWKLILGKGSGGLSKVAGIEGPPVKTPGQLYNLETDPYETDNLYNQYPEIVRELNALLDTYKALGHSKTEIL